MKTIGKQLKYPISLRLPVFLKMEIRNCRYSIFMRLQEEQQIDNKHISVKFCQKTLIISKDMKAIIYKMK